MKQKIEVALRERGSKENVLQLSNWIGGDVKKFDCLYEIFSATKEQKLINQAIWAMRFSVESKPELLSKHLPHFLQILSSEAATDSLKRNGFATLSAAEIPENLIGFVMDFSFRILENPAEKVAAQVFALRILKKMSKDMPEIIPEIKLIIQQNNGLKKPAMKAAVRNLFPAFLH